MGEPLTHPRDKDSRIIHAEGKTGGVCAAANGEANVFAVVMTQGNAVHDTAVLVSQVLGTFRALPLPALPLGLLIRASRRRGDDVGPDSCCGDG